MNSIKPVLLSAVFAFGIATLCDAQTTIVDFEDVGASLADDSSYRGEDFAGGFTSGPIDFTTRYDATFDSWNGAAYSNRTSWTLGGSSGFEEFQFGNDTVVASTSGGSGSGFDASETWGVLFGFAPNEARFEIESGFRLESLQINNTRTTAHVLENGNSAGRPFGAGDSFDVILNSIRVDIVNGMEEITVLASSEPINLASGTSIVRDWEFVDLVGSDVENASTIGLEFLSTDVGMFGINTPTYLAIDNVTLVAVPEPGGMLFLLSGVCFVASKRRRSAVENCARGSRIS